MVKQKILLIDDKIEELDSLKSQISSHLDHLGGEVDTWEPNGSDVNDNEEAHTVLDGKLQDRPILVVADYELTKGGLKGLYGPTITFWCQSKLIPIIEYSRVHDDELPLKQNLFKFRAPGNINELPKFVADITKGIMSVEKSIGEYDTIFNETYSEILYQIFNENCKENCYMHEIVDYSNHLFKNNEFLNDQICRNINAHGFDEEKNRMMVVYLLGHIIVNAIFRFPGPILSGEALCSYIAVDTSELPRLRELFENAKYEGPFNDLGEFFWKRKIDIAIEGLFQEFSESDKVHGSSTRRDIVELKRGSDLKDHGCQIDGCNGKKGGYYCPFTNETVCNNEKCSVGTSSWIPNGATICRVKRSFYDKWKPIIAEF